jgi:hypothetical protein
MKRRSIFFVLIFTLFFSSCSTSRINPALKGLFQDKTIERIAITNSRYAGRYTIIDKKSMERFKNKIIRASEATVDSKLEPDFIFDFYDETKKLATFKYIAGVEDEKIANLIDENGKLYHVSTSVEDEFMKRLMKRDDNKNIPEYYISLINLLIEKSGIKPNNTVIVDIRKDYMVTKSLTSMEQKSILDSIDKKGIKIKFPGEVDKADYTIKIKTNKYTDTSVDTTASVIDKYNVAVKFVIKGNFEDGSWSYHIRFK